MSSNGEAFDVDDRESYVNHYGQWTYRIGNTIFEATTRYDTIPIPLVIATFSATAISRLYRDGNDTGLMAGAGAAGGVFTLVQTDSTTTMPLLISLVLVYLSFHVVYCKVVCRQIAHGEGFVAVTIIIALSLLVVLARSPILIERSGMSSLWTFFPLQMLSMHFCSLALRGLKAYAEM
ncbi:hypothetical protein E8E12_005411 [Didymella heteroderae]|uniref:Uncharacterized protein n=1 Tax=Didymella heteroderae TaxID=1769908 RepID=A0A9P4WZ16_9PLEO|nr:hypothetical protein E8E12_005411 [Didymella heteroderae]